ncbi:MAG: tyrosine-type recombinase/integrase [Boseongicola sp. SB0667_bin_21]|nr:tyrosine-type recombinase/integrase [Boseongicola sp. SB0667_bin_21]
MFETLFARPDIVRCYRAAPLPDERLGYLEHCAQGGASLQTLCTIAAHQVSLVRLLDLHEGERVSVTRVEAAADQWSLPGGRRCSRPASSEARKRFVGHAERWLRFAGLLDEPARARHAHAVEVAAFEAWMRDERGWSEETVRYCLGAVDRFLEGLDDRKVALAEVGIADIDREVTRWQARDCSRITVREYAARLRTFFRFAERRGWCTPGLADGIMPARFHPGKPLPKGLDRDEVLRLLATSEGDSMADLRDRAILMVLVAYGLRSGEVAGLRLDDLDWTKEILRVRRPKPGRTHLYPLSRGVGQAILRYVRDGRPRRPERTLFLTLNAPIRPITTRAIGHVVRSRLDRIGITGKCRGPHVLRHSTAQHLLDHGLSMKEVGDYLGHRGISATSAYARVRLGTLREVAGIDLEGLA